MTDLLAAIIVTHNRADKLMTALDALERQTRQPDLIYVVDNASTDSTRQQIEARAARMPTLRYLCLAENRGGAGGFHAGLKAAYAQGAQYFWLSDDDAYPAPTAIEVLLQSLSDFEADFGWRPSFACSKVLWSDGSLCEMNVPRLAWDWPRFYSTKSPWVLVESCSFVSMMVPRWAVQQHGLPIAPYFIWFEDVEFSRRISGSYPGIYCSESQVTHDIPVNQGVNFGLVCDDTLWKFKYGARNEASFHWRHGHSVHFFALLYRAHQQMSEAQLPRRLRWAIYRAILGGPFFRPKIEMV